MFPRSALSALLGPALLGVLLALPAAAGPNAGGALVLHALEVVHSLGTPYCEPEPLASCAEAVTEIPSTGLPVVWTVYAAFPDANAPRVTGCEFGVAYSSGIGIVDFGVCGIYEAPMGNWPASGSGTVMITDGVQTTPLTRLYWFAGYAYSFASGVSFEVTPHPINGGHFSDDSVVPVLDTIVAYGSLGFGTEGTAPCPEGAATYTLNAEGTGDFPTIQAAIDWAAPGSVIELEDGVYRGPGNRDLDFNNTLLTLRSVSDDPGACILDCEASPGDSHRAINVRWRENAGSLLRGVTIRNGYAGVGTFGYDAEGGAIQMKQESVFYVENCIFENCSSELSGGAIEVGAVEDVRFEDCVFRGNRALRPSNPSGGAIVGGRGRLVLRRCVFEDNAVLGAGGAMHLNQCDLTIEDCSFLGNDAISAGAAWLIDCDADIRNTTFAGNTARDTGGALSLWRGEIRIDECTFYGNSAAIGSAIHGSVADPTVLRLSDSILAFGLGGPAFECGQLSILATGCDIFGNEGGDWPVCIPGGLGTYGNLSLDPGFCDAESGNWGLEPTSPLAARTTAFGDVIGAWPVGCGDPGRGPGALGPLPSPGSTSGVGRVPDLARLLRGRYPGPDGADRVGGRGDRMEPGTVGAGGTGVNSGPGSLRLWVVPQPARNRADLEFAGPAGGDPIRVTIFDVAGRPVRTWNAVALSGRGSRRLGWDGRDDQGLPAPAGSYFVRAWNGGETVAARLTLLR